MSPTPLPAPLAEPLHVLQPSPWSTWQLILAAIVLTLFLLEWWRRRRPAPVVPAPGPTLPPPTPQPVAKVGTIDEIRRRFDVRGQYRRGCHALAEAIRRQLADDGHPSSTWTARDIAERTHDRLLNDLVRRLADVRFGRREPERRDFHELCDQTEAAIGRRRPGHGSGAES